jgi:hypothetical protein
MSYVLAPKTWPPQHSEFQEVRKHGQWHELERNAIAPYV